MAEVIKAIIHTNLVMPTEGFDILVHSINTKKKKAGRNTLVKKTFQVIPTGKKYGNYRGLNIDDLLIVKQNWNKIIGAMAR